MAEAAAERLVTLPINPRQTREALAYLIESIKALADRRRARMRSRGIEG